MTRSLTVGLALGAAFFITIAPAYAQRWGPPGVAAALATAPYVVWNNALEGSNYMSAWTTRDHMSALAAPRPKPTETL